MQNFYSFDIFDTLITRRTASPAGIFALMQKELLKNLLYSTIPSFLKNNFCLIRKEAESFARKNKFETTGAQDITFEDIYAEIANNYMLTELQTRQLMRLEINTELANLVAIPKNIVKLRRLVNQEERVVLISDMYHSSETIRQFLIKISPVFNDIKIYVSSELGVSKHHSDLYKKVKELECVEYKDWRHFGDNIYADFKQAKKLGITPELWKSESLIEYEEKFLNSYPNIAPCSAELLVGSARLVRFLSENKAPVYRFASSFAGPILYEYVSWLINQSDAKGFKTLYFIARDGFVLQKIADVIIANKNLDLKTKYIYGSRKAWRIPNENNIKEYISWTLNEYKNRLSVEFLAERFGLDESKMHEFVNIKDPKKPLSQKQLKSLEQSLLENEIFIETIRLLNKNKSNLLLEYLEQEIDFNENKIAFVDVFGSGRTQDLLVDVIRQKYDNEVITYYFSKIPTQKITNETKKICYFSNMSYNDYAIELLCRNTDGQTLGYKKDSENQIVPIKERVKTGVWEKWGYDSYLQGLIDFAKNYSETCDINNYDGISLDLWTSYLKYFINELDKETADVVGSVPYTDVGREQTVQECAPEYTFKHIMCTILEPKKHKSSSALHYISAKRSKFLFRFLLEKKEGKSFIQRIFSVANSKDRTKKYLYILGVKIKVKEL